MITLACKTCGEKIEKYLSQIRNGNLFCSRECFHKNLRKPRAMLQCETCGKFFTVIKWRIANQKWKVRYCSDQCKWIGNSGEQNYQWINENHRTEKIRIRRSREYRIWRKDVFERDNYTCKNCNKRCGNGKNVYLHAHHILSFADFPKLRFEVSNGLTLCDECHTIKHPEVNVNKQKNL